MTHTNWRTYAFEFLSIFIAVISAFALNNWNDNRKDRHAEIKILKEIKNGLEKDIDDININIFGHESGMKALKYWVDAVYTDTINKDSVHQRYFDLTRDYISIQNRSGYESLKSKGLEIIENDSLRFSIISLYEYDFNIIKKFEEEYAEMQFSSSYFESLNQLLAPNFQFDQTGNITTIDLPLKLSDSERKIFLSILWKIRANRHFLLNYYKGAAQKINQIIGQIEDQIDAN